MDRNKQSHGQETNSQRVETDESRKTTNKYKKVKRALRRGRTTHPRALVRPGTGA